MTSPNRVEKEIATFTRVLAEGGVTSSIPSMFTYWASTYLSPRLRAVFGDADINTIFANEILECARGGQPVRVLSLGSGDCRTEIDIAEKLRSRGLRFEFTCTDLNPAVLEFGRDLAAQYGLTGQLRFVPGDLNREFPKAEFDAIITNHSLHHFQGLEFILDSVSSHLAPSGSFIVSDMIGRNGHMRWPEALIFVENLWEFLPLEKKFNSFAKCHEPKYVNYDCTSDDSFEGVRAQDILPLLLERFMFRKFVGHGNVIDVFIDRIYGGNFSPETESDRKFIDYVERLNTALIDHGVVKPTAMFATMEKSGALGRCVHDRWLPEFCVRRP